MFLKKLMILKNNLSKYLILRQGNYSRKWPQKYRGGKGMIYATVTWGEGDYAPKMVSKIEKD